MLLLAAERRLDLAEVLAGCIRERREPDHRVAADPARQRPRRFLPAGPQPAGRPAALGALWRVDAVEADPHAFHVEGGRDDEDRLVADMIELGRQYGRYGYRRISALLRDAGWQVDDKRVERLWRREGLKVPGKQPNRGRLWLNDASCIGPRRPRRSSRQAAARLRSAERPAWRRNRQCTNIPTGPVDGAGLQAAQATRGLRAMPLTRDFKETIQARIERDPAFAEELLTEGVECLLSGDVDTGKAVLRDYINATVGIQELGGLTEKSPKSLMRMFGPTGNPQVRNLFEVIGCLQEREGLHSKCKPFEKIGNRSARGSQFSMPITGYLSVGTRFFECPDSLAKTTLPH